MIRLIDISVTISFAAGKEVRVGGFTLGSFTSSRFILAHLAMITSEHGAVDLSLLLSNGLMGLTQSVIRLAGILWVYYIQSPI